MKPTSFKFDSKTSELLERLKEESHASSKSEVIRKALFLLELATKAKNNKQSLLIKDETGKEREILL